MNRPSPTKPDPRELPLPALAPARAEGAPLLLPLLRGNYILITD